MQSRKLPPKFNRRLYVAGGLSHRFYTKKIQIIVRSTAHALRASSRAFIAGNSKIEQTFLFQKLWIKNSLLVMYFLPNHKTTTKEVFIVIYIDIISDGVQKKYLQ